MSGMQPARLHDPGLMWSKLIQRAIDAFQPDLVNQRGQLQRLYRYHDSPVWIVRLQMRQSDRIIYAGIQLMCFDSPDGVQLNVIPVVWIDLGADGTLVQPSIPDDLIQHLSLRYSGDFEKYLMFALEKAWFSAMAQANAPEKVATRKVQSRPKSA